MYLSEFLVFLAFIISIWLTHVMSHKSQIRILRSLQEQHDRPAGMSLADIIFNGTSIQKIPLSMLLGKLTAKFLNPIKWQSRTWNSHGNDCGLQEIAGHKSNWISS